MGEVIELHKKPWAGHEGLALTKGQILDMSHGHHVWVEGVTDVEPGDAFDLVLVTGHTLTFGVVDVGEGSAGQVLAKLVMLTAFASKEGA